jgi:hypothetical protein
MQACRLSTGGVCTLDNIQPWQLVFPLIFAKVLMERLGMSECQLVRASLTRGILEHEDYWKGSNLRDK